MVKSRPHKNFQWIYQQAVKRFASAADLETVLPTPLSRKALIARSDADYLSLMSRRVFRAGLQHKMVDAKWPAFEAACYGFQPAKLAALSDEELEGILQADGIIRHWGKIKSIRTNAVFMQDIVMAHGGFGRWLADWPSNDVVGLWQVLKKRGAHLGGHSGAKFLRMAGVDTFLLSDDVVAVLKGIGVVDRAPSTIIERATVQRAFTNWSEECDRPMCQVSRIVSYLAG